MYKTKNIIIVIKFQARGANILFHLFTLSICLHCTIDRAAPVFL